MLPPQQLAQPAPMPLAHSEPPHAVCGRGQSADPLRAWIEGLLDAVFIEDLQGKILEVNPAACRLYGLGREQMIGTNALDLVPPAWRDQAARDWGKLASGEWVRTNGFIQAAAGHAVPVELRANRIDWAGAPALLLFVRDASEREYADEKLRRSEKRYRALFESNPLPSWVYDSETLAFLAVNAAAIRQYGYSREEFLAMTIRDIRPPEEVPALLEHLAQPSQEVMSSGPWKHRMKDGSVIDVQITSHELFLEDRSARLELANDVTGRVRTEQALRRQQALLQNVIAHIPGAIFWKDKAGFYLGCNENSARDMGRDSPAEVIGLTDFDMPFSREEAEFYRQCDRQVMDSGLPLLNIEEPQHRPDGSQAVLLTSKVPLRDEEGQVVGVLGVYTDITARKRAEELIEQRERLFRAVIEAAGAVSYTRNYVAERFEYIGRGIEVLVGYSSDELSAELWDGVVQEVFPAGQTEGMSVAQARALFRQDSSISWHADLRVRSKSGEERWLFNAAVKIFNDQGAVVSAWGLFQDITERRRLEEHLRQSQKMEAIGRLAGGVAHDFNNLLTVITGYGDLALHHLPEDHPSREPVRQVVAAGERAAKLTKQLLAFSRKAILEPRVLILKDVVADMEKMLRRLIGEDIELVTAVATDLGLVKADPGHLEQIILNLVVNARDAMPRGGTLTIEARNVDLDESYARAQPDARPGPHVVLAVMDTGIGMDKATQARVFEPFFSMKAENGTGLGLATVYGAVRQNGGHITLASKPGQGACFKVYLPRLCEPAQPGRTSGRFHLPKGTETVLLAEDEAAVRDLSRRVLQSCGYTVLAAADGGEALHIAEQHQGPIHLLLTDVIMPRMGGRELADRMTGQHPGLQVLFLSGYTDDAVLRHGIREREVAFLQKPFSLAALAQKVREALDQNGVACSAAHVGQ